MDRIHAKTCLIGVWPSLSAPLVAGEFVIEVLTDRSPLFLADAAFHQSNKRTEI